MTANEFADRLELHFNKIANNDAPGYEDAEWSVLLTKAEERFFLQNYAGTNKLREGFEETEKRRKDLSELTSNSELTISTGRLKKSFLPIVSLLIFIEAAFTSPLAVR